MNRQKFLYGIGRPFSPFYSLIMKVREKLYRSKILPVARVCVPVISVGNLTMGGTGKTPVVEYIARMLQHRGMTPAIVSRGYRGSAGGRVNLVSDGRSLLLSAEQSGDEPRLLAEKLPGVPVLTGAARKYPAMRAVENGADAVILDDGFQHLALARDIDLVLFHTDTLAGNSRVFPGGDLREPVRALRRCDAFVMTGVCERNRDRAHRFAALLNGLFPDHPVFIAEYNAVSLLQHRPGENPEIVDINSLASMPLLAFAGIAGPDRFFSTLDDIKDLHIIDSLFFADHQKYGDAELEEIFSLAEKKGARACITTEKDMIKLRDRSWPLPVFTLRMEARFTSDFTEFIDTRLQQHCR